MKLAQKDKEYLVELGHSEADFDQIEAAANKLHTTYDLDGKAISRNEAIELLGRQNYLAGLSRSAFHWSASMDLPDGRTIGFDSSRLFGM